MSDQVLIVIGARPNFVKVAPVLHALTAAGVSTRVLHTGQHYDWRMSGAFLEQLDFPEPDHYLGVGAGTHGEQVAGILVGVEQVLMADQTQAVLVPGDVNSTLAAALAATKLGVRVIHLESGLRSRDWTMPEEVNRVVCDRVSDLLLCHSDEAIDNLVAEGVDRERIAQVGNTMIDSLFKLLPAARASGVLERHGLAQEGYVLCTLHRPALVDDPARLAEVLDVLAGCAERIPVVLPLHPRTRARLGDGGQRPGIRLLDPLDYLEFIALEASARLVITDSGGVQEETSALGVPCLTYRTTTERPVTVTFGSNRLVGLDPAALRSAIEEALGRDGRPQRAPIPGWDGHAGPRAAAAIAAFLED